MFVPRRFTELKIAFQGPCAVIFPEKRVHEICDRVTHKGLFRPPLKTRIVKSSSTGREKMTESFSCTEN